jgi:hypothetical protein
MSAFCCNCQEDFPVGDTLRMGQRPSARQLLAVLLRLPLRSLHGCQHSDARAPCRPHAASAWHRVGLHELRLSVRRLLGCGLAAKPFVSSSADRARQGVVSALAEALVAAQRRAISALEKGYVAGRIERETAIAALDGIGCTDAVDRDRLLLALDTIREWGAQLPAEAKPANGDAEPAKATGAQVTYAQSLFAKANAVPLEESDLRNMPRDRISALIESLKAGTYDPSAWDVPF